MTKPIPKWLQQRYSKLLNDLGKKEFKFEAARKILSKDQEKIVSIIISELKKAGWLNITKLDPNDSRKRFYVLKTPEEIFSGLESG